MELLEGKRPTTNKCVYKTKVTINGILEKLKARFIARGFEQ